jgi:hypothetical protein
MSTSNLRPESQPQSATGFSAAATVELLSELAMELVPVVALYIAASGSQILLRGRIGTTDRHGIVIAPTHPPTSRSGFIAVSLPGEHDRCSYRKRGDLDDQSGRINAADGELLVTIHYWHSRETLILFVNPQPSAAPDYAM